MTSTFGAEFTSLKKVIEEAIAYRYYCRSFGMFITKPTIIHKDNMVVVMNSTNPGSTLQHKSMALSYHYCREHIASGVVEIRHISSEKNLADGLTKELDSTPFSNCFLPFMLN